MFFDQSPYPIRVEWGVRGARDAAARGDITIIADVLSFSSTVVTAVHFGAILYPHSKNGRLSAFAERVQADIILGRAEAAAAGNPTLSPVSFAPAHRGRKFVLASLNGAACAKAAAAAGASARPGGAPAVLIGCLLNASACAAAAERLRLRTGAAVTVVPCGEQWNDARDGDNRLRPAIEDWLGAGAIASRLAGGKSPEAELCSRTFRSSEKGLAGLIHDCGSGRELHGRGYGADVSHCARLDVYGTVPMLQDGRFIDIGLPGT